MAWLKVEGGQLTGPIAKFFTEEEIRGMKEALKAEDGDLILFGADKPKIVYDTLGNLRVKLGKDLQLIDESKLNFLWVTEFPLLAYDEDEKRFVAEHHPFTSPMLEDIELLETEPEKVRANAYDLILNGYELGGGSLRIYQRDV